MSKTTKKVKKAPSKAELARRLYKRLKNRSRQNVMPKLIEKIGLSKAGASTYYNNLRKLDEAGEI